MDEEDNIIPFPIKEEEKITTPFVLQDIDALNGIQFALMSLLTMLGIFIVNAKTLSDKIAERDEELAVSLKELTISLVKVQMKLRKLLTNAANEPK